MRRQERVRHFHGTRSLRSRSRRCFRNSVGTSYIGGKRGQVEAKAQRSIQSHGSTSSLRDASRSGDSKLLLSTSSHAKSLPTENCFRNKLCGSLQGPLMIVPTSKRNWLRDSWNYYFLQQCPDLHTLVVFRRVTRPEICQRGVLSKFGRLREQKLSKTRNRLPGLSTSMTKRKKILSIVA